MRIAFPGQRLMSFVCGALDALVVSRKVDSQGAIFRDQFLVINFWQGQFNGHGTRLSSAITLIEIF
jgi:hypothetical protein